jgi:hypothetical protein
LVDVGNEDGVGSALEAGPDICSEILVLLAIASNGHGVLYLH